MKDETVFSVCPESEFFGREADIEHILERAAEAGGGPCGMYLVGRGWVGKTEVLRRVYHRLFFSQTRVVPVYYQFRQFLNEEDFAEDYLKTVIKQYIAFLGRAPRIAREEVSIKGLKGLIEGSNMDGLMGLISRHTECRASSDPLALLRNALSAPRFISAHFRLPVFLLLDDFDLVEGVSLHEGGRGILREYMDELLEGTPFLISGRTGKILKGGAKAAGIEVIPLNGLKEDEALSMAVRMCGRYGMEFDTEVLTLMVRLTGGAPVYIKNIIRAAAGGKRRMASVKELVELYTGEVVCGTTSRLLLSAVPINSIKELKVAYLCANSAKGLSVEELQERLGFDWEDIKAAVENLGRIGLIEEGYGFARWAGDRVVKDFVNYIYETGVKGRTGEEAKTDLTLKRLKEGFDIQGGKVRGNLKGEVFLLLNTFNGQMIPKALFKNRAAPAVEEAEDEIRLPYIAGCFDAEKGEGAEGLAIFAAQGFQSARYDDKNRVTWVVGVRDAMVPVSASDVEDFIRRANIAVERFGGTMVARWMVSREGFTREALSRMGLEGVWATDMERFAILRDAVLSGRGGEASASLGAPLKEFEISLPMKTRAELVAATAAGEISSEMGFDEDSISEIKSSVIEACINAFEHSKTRFGNVNIRFVVGEDGLAVYVENAGRVFDRIGFPQGHVSQTPALNGRRRGWGMEMMRGLMDVVRLEKVKGGTRLAMVKRLRKHGGRSDGEKR